MVTRVKQRQVKDLPASITDVGALKTDMTQAKSDIAANQTTIATHSTDITNIKSTLQNDVSFLKGTVATKSDLDSLTVPIESQVFVKDELKYYFKQQDGTWKAIVGGTGGGGGGGGSIIGSTSQITKMNVGAPFTVDVVVEDDSNQSRTPIEVLKFVAAQSNISKTKADYKQSESSLYPTNSTLTFDGKVSPKTNYTLNGTTAAVDVGYVTTSDEIDPTLFKSITSLTL